MSAAKNEKADKARTLYGKGHKLVEIAKKLEVPASTVRRWKREQQWDSTDKTKTNDRKKTNAKNERNVRKKGGQIGNVNAVWNGGGAPVGNQNAVRFGLLSKYIPKETMEILNITADTSPIDLLWDQIQIAYAAIIRAQKLFYTDGSAEKETSKISQSKTGKSVEYDVHFAFEKQSAFLTSQARAQSELRSMIKQYDEMIHKNWDIVTEEQKLRVRSLKAKINDGEGQVTPITIINDTKRNPDQ